MLRIGKYEIGSGKPVFIVAEAGINHNGDLQIAKQLIKDAAECGANAVKFQTFFPDEEFSAKIDPKLFEQLKSWSFTKKNDNVELKNYAKKNNIEFFSTPVGRRSVKLLHNLGVKCIKIASGSLTNFILLKSVAKLRLPVIISTGLSTISEIAAATEIMHKENCPFSLLHCNSSYPSPIEDANLLTIPFLQKMFNVPIGYSDHTIGNEACIAAVSLGACIIEKHFTLDKNMEGPDQKLSSDPIEFRDLVSKIRTVEKALGTHRIGPTKSEKKFINFMRYGIGSTKNIRAGTKLTKNMLTTFRPAGISIQSFDNIIGLKIQKSVEKGTPITWDMF